MSIEFLPIPNFQSSSDDNIDSLDYQWSQSVYSASGLNPTVPFIKGDNLFLLQSDTVLFEDTDWKLYTTVINNGNNTVTVRLILYDKLNSATVFQGVVQTGNPNIDFFGLIFAIDDSLERAQVFQTFYYRLTDGHTFYVYVNKSLTVSGNASAKTYLFLKHLPPPVTYNWQSVPSISGKNGILSLVTLDSEAINDGEPVSGAAVSVFDQAPSTDNNVKDLADTYGSGEESSAVDVTVKYKVTLPPGGAFSVLKLVAKKDSIPEDATDGDKIVDISPTKTKKTVTGLDENSMYYFKIFAEDSNSNTSESDEKHILTSGDEGYNFDYAGEIVEWTVPKTGIYSLETWGAQGGDATDGTNSARGGYGAYAYGEVLLTQGEKLYINVGGQNGYGGGGNYTPLNNE